MTTRVFIAAIWAAFSFFATAADAAEAGPVKGTVCFTNSLRDTERSPISCKGLSAKFASVAEIYERGYRVVSSGVVPDVTAVTVFLIIEEMRHVGIP
jgi:hypothetical protein